MSILDDLFGAARKAPGTARRALEGLASSGDPDGDAPAPSEVGGRVRSIDSQLGPITYEIRSIDESAGQLREELVASREEISALKATAVTLNESMARLSGQLEHLLDRVPGLSAEKARERTEEIQAKDGEDDGNE